MVRLLVRGGGAGLVCGVGTVSYTHLDVYKRQVLLLQASLISTYIERIIYNGFSRLLHYLASGLTEFIMTVRQCCFTVIQDLSLIHI